MSLTRKFLTGMGLTTEQVDAIIDEHASTVDSLKEQRDSYKEQADKLKDVEAERDSLKKQVEEGSGDATQWKEKYESLHKEYDDFKKEIEEQASLQAVKDAYTQLLKDNKVGDKHIKSILGVTKFDDMKLDKDGKLEGADKLTEAIKEQWGGFIVTEGTEGAGVETPPSGGSGTKYESKADIMKIKDTTERQAAIKNNPQLFS